MLFYNQRGTTALFERNAPPLYIYRSMRVHQHQHVSIRPVVIAQLLKHVSIRPVVIAQLLKHVSIRPVVIAQLLKHVAAVSGILIIKIKTKHTLKLRECYTEHNLIQVKTNSQTCR